MREIEEGDMEAMRTLFAACDAMTNYGAEHGDLALQRIGQQYAAGVLATDLATLQSLHLVFKPRGAFWVLLDVATGDVVGTIALQDLGGGVGEMRRVCVSSRYRRRGLAGALVAHLQAAALALGLTRVIMSTPVLNAPAIALYARCGFVETVRFPAAGLPSGLHLELVEMAWTPRTPPSGCECCPLASPLAPWPSPVVEAEAEERPAGSTPLPALAHPAAAGPLPLAALAVTLPALPPSTFSGCVPVLVVS